MTKKKKEFETNLQTLVMSQADAQPLLVGTRDPCGFDDDTRQSGVGREQSAEVRRTFVTKHAVRKVEPRQ